MSTEEMSTNTASESTSNVSSTISTVDNTTGGATTMQSVSPRNRTEETTTTKPDEDEGEDEYNYDYDPYEYDDDKAEVSNDFVDLISENAEDNSIGSKTKTEEEDQEQVAYEGSSKLTRKQELEKEFGVNTNKIVEGAM